MKMIKRKSYIEDLVNYVKKNLKKGYTKESLKWALISQGYSKIEVIKAIKRVDEELSMEAPLIKEKPVIKYEVIQPKNIDVEPGAFKKFLKKLFGK